MDEKLAESIKKNKGILRQLTDLNNRVKKLEKKEEEVFLQQISKVDIIIPTPIMSEEKIRNIKVGGTD